MLHTCMVVFKHIDLLYKTMNLYTNALSKNLLLILELCLQYNYGKLYQNLTLFCTPEWQQ